MLLCNIYSINKAWNLNLNLNVKCWVNYCLSFCLFSVGHYIVCPSRIMSSDYPFGIFKLFWPYPSTNVGCHALTDQMSVNALHPFFLILYSVFLCDIRCSGTSPWELLYTRFVGIVLWQTIKGYYTQVCNVHLFTGKILVSHFLLLCVVIV